jgi:hypothetical protein
LRVAALAVLVLLAGCGGSDEATAPSRTVTVTVAEGEDGWVEGDCNAAGGVSGALYRVCHDGATGHVDRLQDGDVETIAITPPARKHGGWHWGALSPNGQTLLLQWYGECEIPVAFLVPARGGTPKPVTGESDWTKAPESVALGWTSGGEPIVRLLAGACGKGADEPGTYVVTDGDWRRLAEKLEPSIEPRDL